MLRTRAAPGHGRDLVDLADLPSGDVDDDVAAAGAAAQVILELGLQTRSARPISPGRYSAKRSLVELARLDLADRPEQVGGAASPPT